MSSDLPAPARTAPEPSHPPIEGGARSEEEVCRLLLPAIGAFAHRRLPWAAAEDFMHDVLVLVLQALREGRVQDQQHLASFALGVCRNLARERARANERRQQLDEQFVLPGERVLSFDAPPGVRRAQLEDCFSQLTLRARRVLRASFCEEFADAEIAADLAVSAPNVRVIRHRSLATLRQCLERPVSWVQR